MERSPPMGGWPPQASAVTAHGDLFSARGRLCFDRAGVRRARGRGRAIGGGLSVASRSVMYWEVPRRWTPSATSRWSSSTLASLAPVTWDRSRTRGRRALLHASCSRFTASSPRRPARLTVVRSAFSMTVRRNGILYDPSPEEAPALRALKPSSRTRGFSRRSGARTVPEGPSVWKPAGSRAILPRDEPGGGHPATTGDG